MSRRLETVARQARNIKGAAELAAQYAAADKGQGSAADGLLDEIEQAAGGILAGVAQIEAAVAYLNELHGIVPATARLTKLLILFERHGSVAKALAALAAEEQSGAAAAEATQT